MSDTEPSPSEQATTDNTGIRLTTPLPPTPELAEHIHDHRITYPELEYGVTVRGSPFICHFTSDVDPEQVATEITTPNDPWWMYGITTDAGPKYSTVRGCLIHVEDGVATRASKLTVEIAPAWMRVYVKEDADAERVAEFVHALASEYTVDTVDFYPTDNLQDGLDNSGGKPPSSRSERRQP